MSQPAAEVDATTGFANASPSSSPSSKRNFNLFFLSAVSVEEEDGVTAGIEGALDTGLDEKRSSVSLSSSSNMDFFLPVAADDEEVDAAEVIFGTLAAQDP